ncbi:DNA cytosine methyltransferase [Pseudomonas sp. NPDC077649]|uniref:DNA cytosine methyltransferase n=1 Tax=Pseudomonas sp. NPDC077649 TaxID=3364423 RepID=UPI0037CCC0F7
MITYGSVCSGIEAATVAWHPLGWRAEWFAEIEPFPSAVLEYRWPEVSNLGDMTRLARQVLAGTIPAPEVLVGGTPCQAFSVAGMRAGLDDPRGQLTIKYVELADATDLIRARRGEPAAIVVWENVPGVLSDKGNAFGCFLGALAGEDCELQPAGKRWQDAGCVYGPKRTIAWRVLDAQYFGLAQRRRRVFVVASARAGFDPATVLFESEGLRRDTPPGRGKGQDPAAGTLRSTDGGSDVDHARASHLIASGEIVGALTAGCGPNGHGGSGLATDKGAEAGHILAFGGNNQGGPIDVSTARNACASASGRMDFESETFVVHGTQDPCVEVGMAHTLGRNNGQENAVLAFSCKDYGADAGELAPTLRAMGHGDSHANAGGQVAVQISAGVRRLTPREGERLQGFPDDYTMIPWRGKPAEECPDGPRYKAIGNSKAVPVVRWIGRRIQRELERAQ